LILICCELDDSDSIECFCMLDVPITVDGDGFDEDNVRRQFQMATAVH
jgi:hypothetical protein